MALAQVQKLAPDWTPDFQQMLGRMILGGYNPSQVKRGTWISIPLSLTNPPFTKVAISLPELIRQTNAFSVKRRAGCEAKLISSKPKELYIAYKVTCHENYSDPKGHDVQVQFDLSQVEKTQDARQIDVRVSCSCPAFLYWGAQWNLHQRDGLHGEARPLLQAPTERLDLRGNFVICKHVKTVFERILPAIQHNIQNIVRKRQVEMNKKRLEEEIPTEKGKRLQDRQEEMRKRKEIDEIVKSTDPEKQKEMIDDLLEEETDKLERGKEPPALPPLNKPTAPKPMEPKKPVPAPHPPQPPKQQVVKRDEKATNVAPPPTPTPKKQPDLNDLIKQEEKKLQQRKKPSLPRRWLERLQEKIPGEWWKKLLRKRTSLERGMLEKYASEEGFEEFVKFLESGE